MKMVKKIYTHTQVTSHTHAQGYVVANKVPNHEAYKMKIHPRKKLPRIFPLFSLHSCLRGRQKKETRKKHCGAASVRVCLLVCARVCVGGGLAACFAFALFAKQSKANESPSLPLPLSPKPLATYHLPLATWLCSVEHMASACRDTSRC